MKTITIRAEVLEFYCQRMCKARQNQCVAICHLSRVAEMNHLMDEGATVKEAARNILGMGKRVMKQINEEYDRVMG